MLCLTCKKSPDGINIDLYDPLLDKPIPNAEIFLVEHNLEGKGLFGGPAKCVVIKKTITDNNGTAVIKDAKLKNTKKYDYFLVVTNCYGKDISWFCTNYPASDFLSKTNKTINKKMYYYANEIPWQVNINNLNTGGFGNANTDSISIKILRDFPTIEGFNSSLNGNKDLLQTIFLNRDIYGSLFNPGNPEIYSCCDPVYFGNIYPGKYKVIVYKNKGGLITTDTYNETVLPVEKYQFNISW